MQVMEGDKLRKLTVEEEQIIARNEKLKKEYLRKSEVESLKQELADSDYKITKCQEYNLVGLELPYDIQELHTERQKLRDEINAKEREVVENAG